jgi:hypothetical protein
MRKEDGMAPHDTDTPKEARRHAGPLIGMAAVLALALAGFLWWVANALQGPDETRASPVEEQQSAPAE